jgi:plasmid maintenance system killer protein
LTIKNRRTRQFREHFERLPQRIKVLAVAAFRQFCKNPDHKALRRHALDDNKKGQHRNGSFSVSVTMQYRAIYVPDGDTNVWYWIGSHNDYATFTGDK